MPQRDPAFATPEMSSDCQPARIDPYQDASASTTEGRLRCTILQAILTDFRQVSRGRKRLSVAKMKRSYLRIHRHSHADNDTLRYCL